MPNRTSPSRGPGRPRVIGAHGSGSGGLHAVADEATGRAAPIDGVLDLDPRPEDDGHGHLRIQANGFRGAAAAADSRSATR